MANIAKLNPNEPDALEQALAVLRQKASDESAAARIFDQLLIDLLRPHHRSLFWGDRLLTLDKSAAFKDDLRFKEAIQQVNSSTGANQYASPDKISWRLHTLIWAASCALKVPGDFVECGVFKGDMSWVVTEAVDLGRAGKKLYAYDTFEGFDLRYSSELDFPEAPQVFQRLDEDYREPLIYESVVERFSEKPYVKVIKGVVPDIFREEVPPRIAFLHLDMNSPSAERAALEVLFDRLSHGAIIVFDDYGWALHRSQKEAADEFMNERGYSILELPTGQGLAVISAADDGSREGERNRRSPDLFQPGDLQSAGEGGTRAVDRQAAPIANEIRSVLDLRIANASREIRLALARAIAHSEDNVRAAINRTVSDSEESVRTAIGRTVSDSEESIRTAIGRTASDSEGSIRAAIGRAVVNEGIESSVRTTLDRISAELEGSVHSAMSRVPGRQFVVLAALASGVTAAIVIAVILIGIRWLHL